MKTLFLYIVEDKKAPVLASLSAVEWLKKGAADTPYCVIEEGEAVSPPASDYFAVLRSSTPLVTAAHLAELILEMEKRGYTGLEIGKGMLVKTTAYFDGFRPKRRANAPFARAVEGALDLAEAEKALTRASAGGIIVVRSSRVGSGVVIPAEESYIKENFIFKSIFKYYSSHCFFNNRSDYNCSNNRVEW